MDTAASAKIIKALHKELYDVFSGIGCFRGTFSLYVKKGMKPYQATTQAGRIHLTEAIQSAWLVTRTNNSTLWE